MKRTHYCGDLRSEHIGQTVTLCGWVWHWRDHGGVIFIDIRDRTGHSQLVFDPNHHQENHRRANLLRSEFVIEITGQVRERPEGTKNPNYGTGEIEIVVNEMAVFSESETPPFPIADHVDIGEDVRLKYRYLDLRRPAMRESVLFRSRCYHVVRNYFNANEFIEVETPVLSKSTPEGARDFLVPSRVSPGEFYALPQSPQIYKQLCMIGGLDRYFQIVKCYRDEDQRADRQPEFTQIDVEMSFITPEDIFAVMEGLMKVIWREMKGVKIETPFPRMPYDEAMARFGCDRPDIRFALELKDIGDIAKESDFQVFQSIVDSGGIISGLCVKGGAAFSRKEIDDLASEAAIYGAKGLAWMKYSEKGLESSIVKFFSEGQQNALIERFAAEPGDLLLFVADKKEIVYPSLSHLRLLIGARQKLFDPAADRFLWIVDWPLFEKDDNGNPTPSHHPFTSPTPDTLDFLETDPFRVRAQAYDLVLNGIEIGGGSIRIHRRDVQSRMFKTLGLTEEKAQERFGFLLDAFRYGAPPHGGIAFGYDRLIMLMLGLPNIREVIVFPKNQRAQAVMEGAPSEVDEEQLRELGIRKKL
ncbi:MAG: aspartate--tRNA ligase [Candidatus Omnitrophota bacterium]|jgi:aspartyl-tRNA synthetase|nr:MAG: aspartate--tRNA ligase [Candidatus Omnitrophota bacterium]